MEKVREKIFIQMNDITKLHVDAIVNAGESDSIMNNKVMSL